MSHQNNYVENWRRTIVQGVSIKTKEKADRTEQYLLSKNWTKLSLLGCLTLLSGMRMWSCIAYFPHPARTSQRPAVLWTKTNFRNKKIYNFHIFFISITTYVREEHVDESAEGQPIVPAAGEIRHRDLKHGRPVKKFSHSGLVNSFCKVNQSTAHKQRTSQ